MGPLCPAKVRRGTTRPACFSVRQYLYFTLYVLPSRNLNEIKSWPFKEQIQSIAHWKTIGSQIRRLTYQFQHTCPCQNSSTIFYMQSESPKANSQRTKVLLRLSSFSGVTCEVIREREDKVQTGESPPSPGPSIRRAARQTTGIQDPRGTYLQAIHPCSLSAFSVMLQVKLIQVSCKFFCWLI